MSDIDFTPKPAKKYVPPPPDYAGLVLSARMAMGAAILLYCLSVFLPFAVFVHQNSRAEVAVNNVEVGFACAAIFFTLLVAGAFSHGVSNLLLAIRDIARNSFRS